MAGQIEHYTWADRIAGELKRSGLKRHVVHGMWTPSGYFHIGNSKAELLIPVIVRDVLAGSGIRATANLIIDDFDDMDKVPAGLGVDEKDYEGYLGKPLREIPSPVKGFDSWAAYFAQDMLAAIDMFAEKPDIISSYDSYRAGKYDRAIKLVLDNARKARDIWVRIAGVEKPEDWIPVMPRCGRCGRLSTTAATSWDGRTLGYSCSEERSYCRGCGHEGDLVPGKGNVKLPWRLHWPATWSIFGTTFESGGKDHFTKGGSVDTGRAFAKEIFGIEPPYLEGVEYIQIAGKKISGSVGNVITLKDWLEVAEPELLRFMMVSYQPQTAIDFDLSSNKLFLLADRYDEAEKVYAGKSAGNEKRGTQLKREYELSQVGKPRKSKAQLGYSIASMISQVCIGRPEADTVKLLQSMGTIGKKLSKMDREKIIRRLHLAKTWAEKYAPEEMRIAVREQASGELISHLSGSEKKAVLQLADELQNYEKEADLQSRIYEIARENSVDPKRFFAVCYQMLIGRDSGPRLGPFIIAIGKGKVEEIFQQVK